MTEQYEHRWRVAEHTRRFRDGREETVPEQFAVAPGSPPPHCGFRWALIDPNEEDRRHNNAHWCRYWPGHQGEHRCACGAHPGDG